MPFLWDMAYYCLDLQTGLIRHFPEGTYSAQDATATGRTELQLMEVVFRAWRTFNTSMAKWGDMERRTAGMLMPQPEPPTRRLDALISRLWPVSPWTLAIMESLRGIDG